eukprot:TRINITY_DN2623_c0_g2_i1.p1 TRINITY_DN2623_c0_g2~~TRINITY_DN2623_c0_g2_i1.p1  ORF type:complete len:332 (+),score=78.16 TRINITY_DN2623_c0_g2_i1:173-1168(+)
MIRVSVLVFLCCFLCLTVAQTYGPGQSGANCDQSAVATAYLNGIFSVPKDPSVIDKFGVDPAYNHNPLVLDGLKNLKAALLSLNRTFNYIRIQRVATQGYFTFVHSKYYLNFNTFAPETEPGTAVVDIFRFTPECKIIEHWDVNQKAVPANQTASGNDMFSCLTCSSFPAPIPNWCKSAEVAESLLTGAFNDRNTTVIDEIINPTTYMQHNPGVPNGIAAFKAFVPKIQPPPLGPLVKDIRAVADGNFVYLHSRYLFSPLASAVVDIFRFDSNCQIVEHWDVVESVPTYTASGNDLFSCISCEKNPNVPPSPPQSATSAPTQDIPAVIRIN